MFKVAMVAGTRFMATTDLEEWAEQIKKGLETPVQGPPEDFDDKLKQAVKRRLNPAASIMASASSSADSLGQRVKRIAQARSNSVATWRKRNEAHKARYHPLGQRKPTRGE